MGNGVGKTAVSATEAAEALEVEQDGAASQATTRYEVTIEAMSHGFDGDQGIVEGTVGITEYVNDAYVSHVAVTSSVIVDRDTALRRIEERLLNSTLKSIRPLAQVSDIELRKVFEETKKDQDENPAMEAEMADEDHKESGRSHSAGPPPEKGGDSYDATRDPRTGRPPNPLEAQRLAREHQEARLSQENDAGSPAEADMGVAEENAEPPDSQVPAGQAPGRMTAAKSDNEETAAIDALVQEGVTREYAEDLVQTHGTSWETLKAAAFAKKSLDKNDDQQTDET